jgi:hypothetical protein
MRIRFDDPHLTPGDAWTIAQRVSELVTGEGGASARHDRDDALARHVADRVATALQDLHGAAPSGARSGGPAGPPVRD